LNCSANGTGRRFSISYTGLATTVTYSLTRGTNFINFPLASRSYSAQSFLEALTLQGITPVSITYIDSFGNFNTYYYNTNINSFDLMQGIPYSVVVTTSGNATILE